MWRVIDLHESLDVPIDISLTTTMVDIYESQYMDLLRRLFTSRVVCLGYHGRPPLPYHTDFDWLGISAMSSEQQRSTIYNYETHGLDLTTGQPTLAAGGYAKLVSLAGYAPPSVGILVDGATLQASADAVLVQLGKNSELYDLMFILRAPMNCLEEHEGWMEGKKTFDFLIKIVEECQEIGQFRHHADAETLAFSIWASVHGIAALNIRGRCRVENEEKRETIDVKAYRDYITMLSKS